MDNPSATRSLKKTVKLQTLYDVKIFLSKCCVSNFRGFSFAIWKMLLDDNFFQCKWLLELILNYIYLYCDRTATKGCLPVWSYLTFAASGTFCSSSLKVTTLGYFFSRTVIMQWRRVMFLTHTKRNKQSFLDGVQMLR